MGSRVIIYLLSRVNQEIEGKQPPCLVPTLNSYPHWLLALANGGILIDPTTFLTRLLFHRGVFDLE
jgi:hypothetical protein